MSVVGVKVTSCLIFIIVYHVEFVVNRRCVSLVTSYVLSFGCRCPSVTLDTVAKRDVVQTHLGSTPAAILAAVPSSVFFLFFFVAVTHSVIVAQVRLDALKASTCICDED